MFNIIISIYACKYIHKSPAHARDMCFATISKSNNVTFAIVTAYA